MATSIVNYIIEKYLSHFVDIDVKATNASLLTGTVEVSNLHIRPELFETLNIPYLDLVEGYINKLKIKMKFPKFYAGPIKISIEKIFIRARQKNLGKTTLKKEIEAMEDFKAIKLQSIEDLNKQIADLLKISSDIIDDILSNIDIDISEVVFRYDDIVSCKERPFSIGFIIKNIYVKPTDDLFDMNFDQRVLKQSERINKKIKVDSFSIYFDTFRSEEEMSFEYLIDIEMMKTISKSTKDFLGKRTQFYTYCLTELDKISDNIERHQYIIYELNFEMNIAYNSNFLSNQKTHIFLDIIITNILFAINVSQIETINKVLSYIKMETLYYIGIRDSYYTRVLSKEEIDQYMENYMKYYNMKYKENNMSYRLPKNVYEYEKGVLYEHIAPMRKAALIKLEYENAKSELEEKISRLKVKDYGIKPKEYEVLTKERYNLNKKKDEINMRIEKEMKKLPYYQMQMALNANEEDKIVKVEIDGDEIEYGEPYTRLPFELAIEDIFISIDKLAFIINENQSKQLFELSFEGIDSEYQKRRKGMKLSFRLSSITLTQFDVINPSYPHLIFTKQNSLKKKSYLISLIYEKNPTFPKSDYSLQIESENRLYIVFNTSSISDIHDLMKDFAESSDNIYKDIRKIIRKKIETFIKSGSLDNILMNNTSINNHERFNIELKLNLISPVILLPIDIDDENNKKCIIINPGQIDIKNTLTPRKQNSINYINLKDSHLLYETYTVQVKSLSIETSETFSVQNEKNKFEYIIEDYSAKVIIDSLIETNNPDFDNFTFKFELGQLKFAVSDTQLDMIFHYLGRTRKELSSLFSVDFSTTLSSTMKLNVIPEEEIEDDINLIKKYGNTSDEDEDFGDVDLLSLVKSKIKLLDDKTKKTIDTNIFRGDDNSRSMKKNKNKFNFIVSLYSFDIYLKKKMTSDEIRAVNLDINNRLVTKGLRIEEKDFIVININDIKMTVNYCYNGTVRTFISLGSAKAFDYDKSYKTDGSDIIFVHPNYSNILICEAKLKAKDETKTFINFENEYNPLSNKTKTNLLVSNIILRPNFSSIERITLYMNYFNGLIMKISRDDNKEKAIDEDFKKIRELKKNRTTPSKGINENYFALVKAHMNQFPDKKSLMASVKNVPNDINTTMLSKKSSVGTTINNGIKEISKGKTKLSIEINNITISFPVNHESEVSNVIDITSNFTLKSKSEDEKENEFNSKHTKILFHNYLVLNTNTNAMLTNVNIAINDANGKNYKVLSNFRISLLMNSYLTPTTQNVITNISLVMEPIKIDFCIKHFHLFHMILDRYKEYKENLLIEYKLPSKKNRIASLLENKLFAKIQKEISHKVKSVSKKVIFESMFNISKFNWYYNFEFALDRCEINLYNDEHKNTRRNLFNCAIAQTSLKMITNNDPVDGMNMANALVEIISGKDIPIEQFNIQTMYRYMLLKSNIVLNYFNPFVNSYEPLIEPYPFQVRLTKVAKVTRLKIDILSNQMLNVNISAKALSMINKFMYIIYNPEMEIEDKDYKTPSLIIENKCGIDLVVTFDTDSSNKIEIEPDKTISFMYSQIEKIQQRRNITNQIYVDKISIELNNYERIKSFDFSTNCSVIYRICSITNTDDFIDVNITSKMEKSIKIITISSCIRFKNQTTFDHIYLSCGNDERRVASNQFFYVPFSWVISNKKILIKNELKSELIPLFDNMRSIIKEEKEKELKLTADIITNLNENETLDENTINDESSVKEKDRGLARVISFMNTEHFCIDVFTFEPVNPYAKKYSEQKLIDIVFNPPIIIENQVPSQFPFSLINYSSLTHKKNNIELLKPFSLYNIFPDDNHTLMKISLDYYNDVYSSHLFNIYELKENICLISDDEDQFNCSVTSYDLQSVYQYDHDVLRMIPEKSASLAKKFIFYFEYIISNCTLYPLLLSSTETTLKSTFTLNTKCVTLISSKSKVMQVKVNNYLSYPFRLDTYGMSGLTKWKQIKRPQSIVQPFQVPEMQTPDLAVKIQTSSLYPNSSIVSFESRYIFVNKTGHNLYIKGRNSEEKIEIENDSLKEMYTVYNSTFFQIGMDNYLSGVFNIEKVDEFDVKLQIEKTADDLMDQYGFSYDDTTYYMIIRVSVTTVDNAAIFITFSHPKYPMLEIDNSSEAILELAVSQSELLTILPGKKVPFCYKNNDEQNTAMSCRIYNTEVAFSFSKFEKKEYDVITEKLEKKKLYLSVSTENDGYTRMFNIKFKDKQAEKMSTYQKLYLKKKIPKATKFTFSLYGIGVSFIDDKPKEIFYLSLYGIDLKVTNTIFKNNNILKNVEKFMIFIKNIQLDYSLNDSIRNIFYPKYQILPSIEQQIANDSAIYYPFIQAFVCRHKVHNLVTEEKVEKYQQVDNIIQEFCIHIDQCVLQKIVDLYHLYSEIIDYYKNPEEEKKRLEKEIKIPDDIIIPPIEYLIGTEGENKEDQMILICYLFLSGLKFELTLNLDINELNLLYVPPLINKIVLSGGDVLKNIKKSPIKFGEMIYQNVFISTKQLLSLLLSHYRNQFLTQLYKLLGHTNLLSNPVRLVDNIGTGYIELYNEPRKGFLQGPNKFGESLNKGVKTLLEKIVTNACESVVNATGTLVNKPKRSSTKLSENTFDGISSQEVETAPSSDGSSTGSEVKEGLTGIFENPYKNARIDGVKGFISGLGTGVLGALISPFTSTTPQAVAAGMKNTTIKYKGGKIKTCRFRHPRVLYQNEPLSVYDSNLAEVNEILNRMKITNYNKILLFADIQKERDSGKNMTVILTDRVFLVAYNLIEIPMMIKVKEIKSCFVNLEGKMYVVYFEKYDGKKEGFRLYEQKIACRIYDIFKQINLENIRVNKKETIEESEYEYTSFVDNNNSSF